MANVVGSRGQIVISKEIRDRLGVQAGWIALQRLVNDHVEVYFVPPEHKRSLKGSLASHSRATVLAGEEWDKATHAAWSEAATEKAASVRAIPRMAERDRAPKVWR
ncbi:MAG: AbrB/MazE/SpoVT family DNA-binding domain-containing protein [Chloroflexi bacterium]|nr:AbrB/MazE/SpoVT family DNA-binding domain-containing protein [Chloroflexota bacterium]